MHTGVPRTGWRPGQVTGRQADHAEEPRLHPAAKQAEGLKLTEDGLAGRGGGERPVSGNQGGSHQGSSRGLKKGQAHKMLDVRCNRTRALGAGGQDSTWQALEKGPPLLHLPRPMAAPMLQPHQMMQRQGPRDQQESGAGGPDTPAATASKAVTAPPKQQA